MFRCPFACICQAHGYAMMVDFLSYKIVCMHLWGASVVSAKRMCTLSVQLLHALEIPFVAPPWQLSKRINFIWKSIRWPYLFEHLFFQMVFSSHWTSFQMLADTLPDPHADKWKIAARSEVARRAEARGAAPAGGGPARPEPCRDHCEPDAWTESAWQVFRTTPRQMRARCAARSSKTCRGVHFETDARRMQTVSQNAMQFVHLGDVY